MQITLNQRGQRGQVAGERPPRGIEHVCLRDLLPCNGVMSVPSQLTEKFPVRSAIPVPEGMQRVHLSEIVRRTPTACGWFTSAEMVGLCQVSKDQRGGTLNISMVRKAARVLREIDRPQVSSPLIEIAEQMTMNRLQMGKIERARKGVLYQFV